MNLREFCIIRVLQLIYVSTLSDFVLRMLLLCIVEVLMGAIHSLCKRYRTRLLTKCAVDSSSMMMLFLSNESSLEISSWKPSLPYVNLNGSMSKLLSEEMAEAKWLSLAI